MAPSSSLVLEQMYGHCVFRLKFTLIPRNALLLRGSSYFVTTSSISALVFSVGHYSPACPGTRAIQASRRLYTYWARSQFRGWSWSFTRDTTTLCEHSRRA